MEKNVGIDHELKNIHTVEPSNSRTLGGQKCLRIVISLIFGDFDKRGLIADIQANRLNEIQLV